MIHSINLLAFIVSDRKSWCGIWAEEYNYYVPNRGLELEYHEPDDPLGGYLLSWGQIKRHPRGGVHNRS